MRTPCFLFAALFGLSSLASCASRPVASEAMTGKEQIKDNLIVFPLVKSGARMVLASYSFKDHRLRRLLSLEADASLEDVSSDKDVFLLTDRSESRLTAFSVERAKIVFQKEFASRGKRIGIVRISPDKKTIAISWRGRESADDLTLVRWPDGTVRDLPATTGDEVSDLHWSSDGAAVLTATYSCQVGETIWARADARTFSRQSSVPEPQEYFPPYHSRETDQCGFDLKVTLRGSGSTKSVRSIDRVEAGRRSPILEFGSGPESYPHGMNDTLWKTPSCKTALLRVRDILYAIDLENRRMAEILTGFSGPAAAVPAKMID